MSRIDVARYPRAANSLSATSRTRARVDAGVLVDAGAPVDAGARPDTAARGALSNRSGRFETRRVVPLDDEPDGTPWDTPPADGRPPDAQSGEASPPLRTTVTPEATRTIITRNDSPDVPFDRSINPYRGCEHGCVYCFARPSHAYLGLSPGLDFETRIISKPGAPDLLRKELAKPGYRCEPLALGANTDP